MLLCVIISLGGNEMYNLGDKIVYPMHGAGIIEAIEEKEVLGEKKKYYVIAMPCGDMKLMVPVDNAESIGVRDIIDNQEVENVYRVLEQDSKITEMNWNKRYRSNMDRMKSGDIYEIARIVRNLSFRDSLKGLSTGEKKMLNNAKQILVSELILADGSTPDYMNKKIEGLMDKN
jgi:CarD family transcriptional regulator